jgi:hypothetical protein
LSSNPILIPKAPLAARLYDGSVDDWHAEQREAARAEGYAAALQEAAQRLDDATAQLDKDRLQALEELPGFALRFAQEVARHLIRTTIQAGEHDIEGMIRDALARSGVGRSACLVHISPDDMTLLEGVTFRKGTEVQGDPSLPQGSVHVSTPQGLLVRDIDTCIRAAAEQIYKTMPGRKIPMPVVKPVPPQAPKMQEPQAIATNDEPDTDSETGADLISPEPVHPELDDDTLRNPDFAVRWRRSLGSWSKPEACPRPWASCA